MRYFTQFSILHQNIPYPEAGFFCPFIWESGNFDSDGNDYFDGTEGFYTDLTLSLYGDEIANFELFAFREGRGWAPPTLEAEWLGQHCQHFRNGQYGDYPHISLNHDLAVVVLQFETDQPRFYREYLYTVYEFLKFSKGVLLNRYVDGAEDFKAQFLDVIPHHPS